MTHKDNVYRGEIYYVDFEQNAGSSMNGLRPALVISNDVGNQHGPTVIVAAISSSIKAMWLPTHLIVEYNKGLKTKSMVMLEQIKTVDKACLQEKVGSVSADFLEKVDRALTVSVGLDEKFNRTGEC